jgi:hypothetical protein
VQSSSVHCAELIMLPVEVGIFTSIGSLDTIKALIKHEVQMK